MDLRIKKVEGIALRIPQWARRGDVRCTVNGASRQVRWSGNYIELSGLDGADRLGKQDSRSDDTIIEIDPKSELYPLCQRDFYRQPAAPLRRKTRFVSS